MQYEKPVQLRYETVFPDYALVPKHEQNKYKPLTSEQAEIERNIIPQHVEYPPFLKRLLQQRGESEPKLNVIVENNPREPNLYRMANENETPTKQFPKPFGEPINKTILTGINYNV